MHIIHGTWIPDDTHEFIQRGAFYLWVETDTPSGKVAEPRRQRSSQAPGAYGPGYVSHGETGPAGAYVWRVGAHPVH